MIVGAYTLDLYCDNDSAQVLRYDESATDFPRKHLYNEFPHQFVGKTFAGTVRDARRSGWIVSTKRMKCYCPKCAKKNS